MLVLTGQETPANLPSDALDETQEGQNHLTALFEPTHPRPFHTFRRQGLARCLHRSAPDREIAVEEMLVTKAFLQPPTPNPYRPHLIPRAMLVAFHFIKGVWGGARVKRYERNEAVPLMKKLNYFWLLIVMGLFSCRCLYVKIDSLPEGANIRTGTSLSNQRTPNEFRISYSPDVMYEHLSCCVIELVDGVDIAAGRLLCYDLGFPYYVTVRNVESMDGSAWTAPFNEIPIRVQFAQRGKFLVATEWWRNDTPKPFSIDGERIYSIEQKNIFNLDPGKHEIIAMTWSAKIEADELFSIHFDEFGAWGFDENLYLCIEPDQFEKNVIEESNGAQKIIYNGMTVCSPAEYSCILKYYCHDGRSCLIELRINKWTKLHLKVTTKHRIDS